MRAMAGECNTLGGRTAGGTGGPGEDGPGTGLVPWSGGVTGRQSVLTGRAAMRWPRSGGGQIGQIGHAATARPGRSRWGAEQEGSQMARVAGPAVAGGPAGAGGLATGTLAKRRSQ